MIGPAGEEPHRTAVPEGDPQRLDVTPPVPADHGRDAAARVDLEEQLARGRPRIGSVERPGPVGQEAPDRPAVRREEIARRPRGLSPREGRAERVAIGRIELLGQGVVVQAACERSGLAAHDQGPGARECEPRVIDFGGAA
jgi:hypothetical protein